MCFDEVILEKEDIWQYLQKTKKPIVLYGMGNGADKILSVMEQYGLACADVFASDGFVRGHSFHGKRVLSYHEAKEKYGDMLILISFASNRPEVLSLFRTVETEFETLAPDVPVSGNTFFTYSFFKENEQKLKAVYQMLADEESRRIYGNILNYKLSGKLRYLWEAESSPEEAKACFVKPQTVKRYFDIGAYNGDTIRALLEDAHVCETVYAMEPDARNYKKLLQYAETETRAMLRTFPYAAWDKRETLVFLDEGNRNSTLAANALKGMTASQTKEKRVEAEAPDVILGGESVDYIKYDVEGAEARAICGTEKTLRQYHPRLLVSLYHRSEDLFALPLLLSEIAPDYRFYIRRFPYIPAWDINLYCL